MTAASSSGGLRKLRPTIGNGNEVSQVVGVRTPTDFWLPERIATGKNREARSPSVWFSYKKVSQLDWVELYVNIKPIETGASAFPLRRH